MKIRSHFILVLALLTVVPILFLTSFVVYLNLTSPERVLFSRLEKMKGFDFAAMPKSDKDAVVKYLRERPPSFEEAFFFSDGMTILSTIPHIPGEGRIDAEKLSFRLFENSDQYYYQLSAIPIQCYDGKLIHLVRYPKNAVKSGALREGALPRPRNFVAAFVLIFEAIFAILSLFIMNRIAGSIRLVEQEAKKLDDGDVEKPIHIPLNKGHSNEITNLLTHLESFRKTFKQRKKRRDSFVMGLSHDLKTPLAVIKGYSEGIADGLFDGPKKRKEALDVIVQKATSLESMVDELVNFVKMNESDWNANMANKDLKEFLESFATYIKPTCEIFNREMEASIQIPSGVTVKMDEQMLSRALGNIFSNAIRYSNPKTTVFLDARMEKDSAVITITDQGIGITQEDAGQVFKLFYRGTRSRREQGHGIGLSVAKTATDIHGWDIRVESELHKGSSFIITIPLTS